MANSAPRLAVIVAGSYTSTPWPLMIDAVDAKRLTRTDRCAQVARGWTAGRTRRPGARSWIGIRATSSARILKTARSSEPSALPLRPAISVATRVRSASPHRRSLSLLSPTLTVRLPDSTINASHSHTLATAAVTGSTPSTMNVPVRWRRLRLVRSAFNPWKVLLSRPILTTRDRIRSSLSASFGPAAGRGESQSRTGAGTPAPCACHIIERWPHR